LIDQTLIIIIGCCAIFVAGFVSGLTGSGYALISVPVLILMISPKIVVPVILILSVFLNIYVLIEARRWIDIKRIYPLMIAGVAGMPFGTHLLKVLNVEVLKVFIGLVIVLFALAFFRGFRKEIKNEKIAFAPVGFASGLLNGATAMSGPPVILFFTNQGVPRQVFRANAVAYFLVLNLITLPYLALNGLITKVVINYSLYFLPFMTISAFIGIRLSHRIKEDNFRKIVLLLVTFAGIASVLSGLGIIN